MYANGRHSDLTRERALHLGIPLIIAGLLLFAAIYCQNLTLAYAMLVLTVALNWSITPIFWAVTTESLIGVAGAASIALINAVANIAGLAFPPIMGRIKDVTGSYDMALMAIAAALVIGGIIGLRLGRPQPSLTQAPVSSGQQEHHNG